MNEMKFESIVDNSQLKNKKDYRIIASSMFYIYLAITTPSVKKEATEGIHFYSGGLTFTPQGITSIKAFI